MGQKRAVRLKKNSINKQLLIFLSLIFLINFVLKISKISSIPPGATYDEMVYITESQIILKYGTDASGQWQPWQLSPAQALYSELTSTTLIPGFLLFSNNQILASKIIPVLMGSMIPILLALIVYYFVQKNIFLISTTIVATFNPWIFQFSRMSFDSLFSVFFYLLGMVMLLYLKHCWKTLASLAFFWGFFQYQGHKIILIPFLLLFYLILFIQEFSIDKKNRFKKAFIKTFPVLVMVLFSILLTSNYLLRLKTMEASTRINEFSLIDQNELSNMVMEKRKLALDSPLVKIYDNKLTVYFSIIAKRFLKSFDPLILFFRGDANVDSFAVTAYGFFHFVDILLICSFLILLAKHLKNYRLILFFLISFTLLGTMPNLVKNQDTWITFRGAFVYLGLIMMSSIGLSLAIDLIKDKKKKILILLVYLLSVSPFFYLYFIRYPITQTAHRGFYQRILANYIKRASNNNFILITDSSAATYDYLLTYNQYIKTEPESQINAYANKSVKKINNEQITIFETCPENLSALIDDKTVLIVDRIKEPCVLEKNLIEKSEIVSLIDSGTFYTITNDQLCSQFNLHSYVNLKENYLAIENLDLARFCTSFFVKR